MAVAAHHPLTRATASLLGRVTGRAAEASARARARLLSRICRDRQR